MQAKIERLKCVTHEGSYLALELEGPDVRTAPNCIRQLLRVPSAMYPKTADHLDDHAAMEVMFGKLCTMVNAYSGLKQAAEELENTLEWFKTGNVNGIPCDQHQLTERISKVLAQQRI